MTALQVLQESARDCLHAARTDRLTDRKEERGELAGEVTSELQVVGKAASIAIQTRRHGCETKQNKTTRNNDKQNDKTKARAEEREKSIGWIGRLFTAWRVSHAERTERRAEREEEGGDDSEEDEPVEIPLSAASSRTHEPVAVLSLIHI